VLEIVSAPLYFASSSNIGKWTKCLTVIIIGNNPYTEGQEKWCNVKKTACGKILRCTNKDQIRNLSRYIHIYIYIHIQGVPGGMDKTSGECSLG